MSKTFLGVKNGSTKMITEYQVPLMTFLDPLVVLVPKIIILTCSEMWGPGPSGAVSVRPLLYSTPQRLRGGLV